MGVQYTNRRGDVYHLQQGQTRTGKPRYWLGRKVTGEPVELIPEGYEIYEHPEMAQVFFRKIIKTKISPFEKEMLEDGIRRFAGLKHFIVDVEKDALVVYLPSMSDKDADRTMSVFSDRFLESSGLAELRGLPELSPRMKETKEWLISHSAYGKMMRFVLSNAKDRTFLAERWCFLGGIDNWMHIGRPGPLKQLVQEYAQHLGKESFYELM